MKFTEAKKRAEELQNYLGKDLGNGRTAKVIIPMPQNVTLEELKTYSSAYLLAKNIDHAAKITQTEENEFEIGVLTSEDIKDENIGIGLLSSYFPETAN